LRECLNSNGIACVPDIYSVNEMGRLNQKIDNLFLERSDQPRSYIRPDDMNELGIMDEVLNPRMMDLLFSIIPDPVLYHFHFYEIAAKQEKSHIFSENLLGWHRDPDCTFRASDPTHLSIFVYFSDVGPDDGPFEFVPNLATENLSSGAKVASMQGPAGMSFVWHRRFFHRAAPNRGSLRRRLLKISVQNNEFKSAHLKRPFFRNWIDTVPEGNIEMDMLLGRFQGKKAPKIKRAKTEILWDHVRITESLNLSTDLEQKLVEIEEKSKTEPVAYD